MAEAGKYSDNFGNESVVMTVTGDIQEKKAFNGLMKAESCYKAQVDNFLSSAASEDIVVVLINFCAIGGIGDEQNICDVIPGEMALTAFSLKDGIIDNCSIMVNHGKDLSENTQHTLNGLLELPIPVKEKNNYGDIVWILNLFRRKHRYGRGKNQNALLFCRKAEYTRVTSSLNFLFDARGGDEYGFQVFPIEYLVLRMATDIYAKNPGLGKQANDDEVLEILDNGDFKNLNRLACLHHHKTQTGHIYCPLKAVNVLAYNIIGSLVDTAIATPGDHYPTTKGEKREISRRQNQIMAWVTCYPHRISFPITLQVLEDEVEVKIETSDSEKDKEGESSTPKPPLLDISPSSSSSNMPHPPYYPQTPPSYPNFYPGWNPFVPPPPPFGPGFCPYPPPTMPGQQFPYPWPPMGNYDWQLPNASMPYYPMMPYGPPPPPSGQTPPNPMDPTLGNGNQPGNFNRYPNFPMPFFAWPPPNFSPLRGPPSADSSYPENQDVSTIQTPVERLAIQPSPNEPPTTLKGRPG